MKGEELFGVAMTQPYKELPRLFWEEVLPTAVSQPELCLFNEEVASQFGWSVERLSSDEGVAFLAGNQFPSEVVPYAQAYMGHQFGHLTMLGDGRAIVVGDVATADGPVELQWKGSGRTPFSRGGDGRGALGPMLREFVLSEGMHQLGVPTARTLATTATNEPVIREAYLPGGVNMRVAKSHLRVGTFEYAFHYGSTEDIRALADFAIRRMDEDLVDTPDRYAVWLDRVVRRQAHLVTEWQRVGFIHGVMNTDNTAISGETIDYGPAAFMDIYSMDRVYSSIDRQGRYRFGNQPGIAAWNLARLAEVLVPILAETKEEAIERAQSIVGNFIHYFEASWLRMMREKCGLVGEEEGDESLVKALLQMMETHEQDYTNTFRALTLGAFDDPFFETPTFRAWKLRWDERRSEREEEGNRLMKRANPMVIPRNQYVDEAIDDFMRGDETLLHLYLDVLKRPYEVNKEQERFLVPDRDEPYVAFCGT